VRINDDLKDNKVQHADYTVDDQKKINRTDKPVAQPLRVLIIDHNQENAQRIRTCCEQHNYQYDCAESVAQARQCINKSRYDLLLTNINLPDGSGLELNLNQSPQNRTSRTIMMSENACFEEALQTIRSGAADFLTIPFSTDELEQRIQHSINVIQGDQKREARVRKLKRICKRLNTTRLDVTSQIDSLCNDLVGAYQELADQISHVTTVAEFAAIIRQELDVEELLRTALEYLLRKIGPTNAAIFLPDNDDEFSLGAYVNYDCPQDTSDYLLDHLADVIAPRMADEDRVLEFTTNEQLADWIGDDAAWLTDSHVVSFSCRYDDECLAVFAFFRDINDPFEREILQLFGSLSQVFAKQIAHVIHVHHRHLPIDEDDNQDWNTGYEYDEEDEDDIDLAA